MLLSVGLTLLGVLRALAEIAGLFLLGRGTLYLLTGRSRDDNPIYQLFCIVTRPSISISRRLLSKLIADRHIPVAAFLLLFCLWILLAYVRLAVSKSNGFTGY